MHSNTTCTINQVEKQVRAWLDDFVVGLNLCPFARPVVASKALRITICDSGDLQQVAESFVAELELMQQSSESAIATTLLVLPNALNDFEQYLGFIENAETLIDEIGLCGTIQLASFHPDYQFEGEPADSASHFSNRSPFPLIHFLREDMMERVLENFPNPEQIPQRNIETLEAMGREDVERILKNVMLVSRS
ncbi:MAG: DUF1415 domain-containing protein [Porticoccaceae bacterium]|nr:DUF1415 domain-containing protein [Porticoccaceae bacterium]MDG1307277.1 DUF1415 domain-containing protein [Porticoccaceae bacterium]